MSGARRRPAGRPFNCRDRGAHAQPPAHVRAAGWRAPWSAAARLAAGDAAQACRALQRSTEDLARLFESALASRQARVKGLPMRTIKMLTYLMQHDAHHRGQICMIARDLGHRFTGDDTMRLWGWKAMDSK